MNRLSSPASRDGRFYDAQGKIYPHISTITVDGKPMVRKTDTLYELGDPILAQRLREEQVEFFQALTESPSQFVLAPQSWRLDDEGLTTIWPMVEHQTLSSRSGVDVMLAANVLKGDITPRKLLEFMIAWTAAIAHINELGFVHGDVNNNNVFVDYSAKESPKPLVFDYDVLSRINKSRDSGFGSDPLKDVKDLSKRFMHLTTLNIEGRAERSLTGEWIDSLYNQIVFGLEGKLSAEKLSARLTNLTRRSDNWKSVPVDESNLSRISV